MNGVATNSNGSTATTDANTNHAEQHGQQTQRRSGSSGTSSKTSTTANISANSNSGKIKTKKPVCNANISQFLIETYFIWFSALIFITELTVDVWLAALYFHRQQPLWGLITAAVIVVPLGLCQMYSLWLLRTDHLPVRAAALGLHVLLLGIPYRYHGILRRVEQDKSNHHLYLQQQLHQDAQPHRHHHQSNGALVMAIRHQISDANAIQTMNATFQYCPQFLFQSFLIVYRKYKCILTGVSAGLAGFSFLWHIFIHFYYLVKRYHETDPNDVCFDRCYQANVSTGSITAIASPNAPTSRIVSNAPHIIDNLSTAPATTGTTTTTAHLHASGAANVATSSGPSSLVSNNLSQTSASLTDSMRNFEKPQYKTDDNNLMSKRGGGSKMVEKSKIFGFNKRRPIYQQPHEDFDMNESVCGAHHNTSTVFFEIDDSRTGGLNGTAADGNHTAATTFTGASSKFNVSMMSNKDLDNFLNENHSNANVQLAKKTMNDYKYSFSACLNGSGGDLAAGGCSGVGTNEDDDIDDLKRENRQLGHSMQHSLMSPKPGTSCIVEMAAGSFGDHHCNGGVHRNSLFKRKGICSSQEMLHLVDIMNDHISAEQVDVLAKSLVELGDCSLPPTESAESTEPGGDLDHSHAHQHSADNLLDHSQLLLDHFPQHLDDRRLLENIDAAIYENQIIFQERIRKNQLTIQNLKLQDQLLSKCIEDMKSGGRSAAVAAAVAAAAVNGTVSDRNCGGGAGVSAAGLSNGNGSEILSIRDYENMCFTNISRQQRGMKHWRNYFQDMDTSQHDSSTVQHSSYYVNTNTMSNSTADLYINEDDDDNATDGDDGGASTVIIHDDEDEDDDGKGTSAASVSSSVLGIVSKKGVRWSNKLAAQLAPRAHPQQRMRSEHFGGAARGAMVGDGTAVGASSSASGNQTAVSDDIYINQHLYIDQHRQRHVDGVGSAISMDASSTTMRGSHSSVVVEMDEDDEEGDEELVGAVALPQKNMLVETINKINVDSPVKSLLGQLKAGGQPIA